MCGRFFFDPDDMSDEELIALLDREQEKNALAEEGEEALKFGEVYPGDYAAVIALNRKSERSAFVMRWGYHVNRRLIINARSETAAEKPLFQQSMRERRCLIPASAYFEWDHRNKPLQKYRFTLPKRNSLYLAGIYRFEKGEQRPVFTIVTRDASDDIACFHARMPVIISAEDTSSWLDRNQSANDLLCRAITKVNWERA